MRKTLIIVSVAAIVGLSFGGGKPTVSTFTDKRDGKVYKIVKVGSQTWFAENLNYAAKGSVCYDSLSSNCTKYGRLYTWEAAMKACPAGFHLPSFEEWETLENTVDNSSTAGKKLKSTSGWHDNGNGTDKFGFAALPGGYGDDDGNFDYAGYYGVWWCAATRGDRDDSDYAWGRGMVSNGEDVYMDAGYSKTLLLSVRCVAD